MDRYLSLNVFEQPWAWALVGLLLFLGFLAAGRYWPLKIKRKHLLIGPAVVLLAFGLDWLISTDAEKIETVLAKIVRATEEEDAEEIIRHIGSGYSGQLGASREVFASYCRATFKGPQIEDHLSVKHELELDKGKAALQIVAFSQLDRRSQWAAVMGSAKTVWDVRLAKQADKSWKIVWIDLLEFNNEKVDWRQIGIDPRTVPEIDPDMDFMPGMQ